MAAVPRARTHSDHRWAENSVISVVELEGARPRLDSEILPQNGLGRDTGQKEKNREKKIQVLILSLTFYLTMM